MKFAVINPEGRDPARLFPNGAGIPVDPGHPPINYHAYAACMDGGFFRLEKEIPKSVSTVLVLLRRDLKCSLRVIQSLKASGVRCLISWKESGTHQIAEMLDNSKRLGLFLEICAEADGFLSSTQSLIPLYQAAGCVKGNFLPTPYPVNQAEWNFARPANERQGIFMGTREFDVPSRNHLAALLAACALAERLGTHVTCIYRKKTDILDVLTKRYQNLRPQKGPFPYVDYLAQMAAHRVVFQWDQSEVPGQVAGDATLCRIPCVGGNSAIEELVFPEFSGAALSREQSLVTLEHLLTDEVFYTESCNRSEELAQQLLSYESVSFALNTLIAQGI
ncbi:MAG: hypothetical protein ABI615_04445 [Chthoniobacterales bacterium]